MKTYLFFVLVSLSFLCSTALADPIGAAFTYQGRLLDDDVAAGGSYDLLFRLFDSPIGGNQVATAVNIPDVEVIDGYFMAELDFGNVFDSDERWLDISVRPGELADPNPYTSLLPRQKIAPTPYALYAVNAGNAGTQWTSITGIPSGFADNIDNDKLAGISAAAGQVVKHNGIEWIASEDLLGPMGPVGPQGPQGEPGPTGPQGPQGIPGDSHWGLNGTATYYSAGNVGVGTNYPERAVHIAGANPRILIEATAMSPEINFKNTGDASSNIWSVYKNGSNHDFCFYQNGNKMTIQSITGNIGVGTSAPAYRLDVAGPVNLNKGLTGTALNVNGTRALWFNDVFFSWGFQGYANYFPGDIGIGTSSPAAKMDAVSFVEGDDVMAVRGIASIAGDYVNYGGYFEAAGSHGIGVRGENTASDDYGYLGGSDYGVYGYSSNTGVRGESDGNGVGVSGKNNTSANYGYLGGSANGVYGYSYGGHGVYGYGDTWDSVGVYGASNIGHGVYGKCNSSYYGGKAGYFEGDVYVTGQMSAQTLVDRTPYPKDTETAYAAVMSMERLPDGLYQENSKEQQLDHSKLNSFIRSEDGNRDLSATVSCLNEVVKDLIRENRELKERLAAVEAAMADGRVGGQR